MFTDIIYFSYVGGGKAQLLKRVSVGHGFRSTDGHIVYSPLLENGYCQYKPLNNKCEIKYIELSLTDNKGVIIRLSPECEVTLSLHFKDFSL